MPSISLIKRPSDQVACGGRHFLSAASPKAAFAAGGFPLRVRPIRHRMPVSDHQL